MRKIDVWRNEYKERYEFTFQQENGVVWARFLDDDVYKSPARFSKWMKTLFEDIKIRS